MGVAKEASVVALRVLDCAGSGRISDVVAGALLFCSLHASPELCSREECCADSGTGISMHAPKKSLVAGVQQRHRTIPDIKQGEHQGEEGLPRK